MSWTWHDLVFYTGAVYGLSWLSAKSRLFAPVRARASRVPLLGELSACIVCTSGWVAIAWIVLGTPGLLSAGFCVTSIADAALLVGWTLFATWVLARLLGDAD